MAEVPCTGDCISTRNYSPHNHTFKFSISRKGTSDTRCHWCLCFVSAHGNIDWKYTGYDFGQLCADKQDKDVVLEIWCTSKWCHWKLNVVGHFHLWPEWPCMDIFSFLGWKWCRQRTEPACYLPITSSLFSAIIPVELVTSSTSSELSKSCRKPSRCLHHLPLIQYRHCYNLGSLCLCFALWIRVQGHSLNQALQIIKSTIQVIVFSLCRYKERN